MPRVTLLGSAATVAGRENDSIYLLLQSADGDYMIDCGGSAPHKLARAGAELARLRGVLLTHDHADHIYGFPLLVQALMLSSWATAGPGELTVWGLPETLVTARGLLDLFQLADRIPIDFQPLVPEAAHLALETAELRIFTTPVQHSRPTVGVRIEGKASGRVLAYSSDTEPCAGVRQLAAGADLLLHEATESEPTPGHSTPAQAGQVAAAAGVSRLILVHFAVGEEAALIAQAAKAFGGPVQRGCDWATFEV